MRERGTGRPGLDPDDRERGRLGLDSAECLSRKPPKGAPGRSRGASAPRATTRCLPSPISNHPPGLGPGGPGPGWIAMLPVGSLSAPMGFPRRRGSDFAGRYDILFRLTHEDDQWPMPGDPERTSAGSSGRGAGPGRGSGGAGHAWEGRVDSGRRDPTNRLSWDPGPGPWSLGLIGRIAEEGYVMSAAEGTSTFTIELPEGVLEPLALDARGGRRECGWRPRSSSTAKAGSPRARAP